MPTFTLKKQVSPDNQTVFPVGYNNSFFFMRMQSKAYLCLKFNRKAILNLWNEIWKMIVIYPVKTQSNVLYT